MKTALVLSILIAMLSGCTAPPVKETMTCRALSTTVRDADGKSQNVVTENCLGTYEKSGEGAYPTFPESRKDGDWRYR